MTKAANDTQLAAFFFVKSISYVPSTYKGGQSLAGKTGGVNGGVLPHILRFSYFAPPIVRLLLYPLPVFDSVNPQTELTPC